MVFVEHGRARQPVDELAERRSVRAIARLMKVSDSKAYRLLTGAARQLKQHYAAQNVTLIGAAGKVAA